MIRTVLSHWHVLVTNARIHVLDLVASMLNATSSAINQYVAVYRTSKVIHLRVAVDYQVKCMFFYFRIQNLSMLYFISLCIYFSSFSIKHSVTFLLVFEPPSDPCNPIPCGTNAICMERNGAGSCTCITGYHGDPYIGCRPECMRNNDCPHDKACLGMKCRNPCPGSCGLNAECEVINHIPQCFCPPEYTGNPVQLCKKSMKFPAYIFNNLNLTNTPHRTFAKSNIYSVCNIIKD